MAPKFVSPACTSLLVFGHILNQVNMICHKHLRLDKIKTKLSISPLRSALPATSQLIKTFGEFLNSSLSLILYVHQQIPSALPSK